MDGLYRNPGNIVAIVLLAIAAAVGYGIVHDQITVQISRVYFTVLHPPILGDAPSWVIGLFWGIIATWWVGLILGVIVALCANWGDSRPAMPASRLFVPITKLLAAMAVSAALAGCLGFVLATYIPGMFRLPASIPENLFVRTISVAFTHGASYLSGFVGGLVLAVWTWGKRKSLAAI